MGTFWYQCANSQLVPRGCITPNGRITLGQTYDMSTSIRWLCTIDNQGYPAMIHRSCLIQGRERQPNEQWEDSRILYECQQDRSYLSIVPIGCVTEDGKRLRLGEKVNVGDIVYVCKLNRYAVPSYVQSGCFGKDQRQYATGDEYTFGDVWYYCMEKDGRISSDPIGCVSNGQRLRDGERAFVGDVIFSCVVRGQLAELKVSGCVTKNMNNGAKAERRVGCSWQEGDEPYQVTFQCAPDDLKKTAVKTAQNCDYALDRGTYKIEIGCYRVIDKKGIACLKNSADPADVRLTSWPVDENGQIVNPPPNARYC
jgi:hypothetical protein